MDVRQLITELSEVQTYSVVNAGIRFEVRVELVANNHDYVQVMLMVHDGTFPSSAFPPTGQFIRPKLKAPQLAGFVSER